MKLVALYRHSPDPEAFSAAYHDTHLPLIKQVPGLQDLKLTRFTRSVIGDDLHLMAELTFADEEALKAAMRSPEMAAAGENLDSFAEGLYSLLYAEQA